MVSSGTLEFRKGGMNSGTIAATAAGTKVQFSNASATLVNTGALNGAIDFNGVLEANAVLTIAGRLRIGYSSNAIIRGSGSLVITGRVTSMSRQIFGAQDEINVPITINAGGTLDTDWINGSMTIGAAVTNNGTISTLGTNASTRVTLNGNMTNAATLSLTKAGIAVGTGRTLTNNASISILDGATIDGSGTLLNAAGATVTSSILSGACTIGCPLNNQGTITVNSGNLSVKGGGVNWGTITQTAMGSSLSFFGASFSNNGTLNSTDLEITLIDFNQNNALTINGKLTMATGFAGGFIFIAPPAVLQGSGSLTVNGQLNVSPNTGTAFVAQISIPTTISATGVVTLTDKQLTLSDADLRHDDLRDRRRYADR
jgi:hypothetical protein